MKNFQTELHHLPVRHWSELRRFLSDWAQVYYLAFHDYRPFTHVREPLGNKPDDAQPYYGLILQRRKGGGRTSKECDTEPIVWIHKNSMLLSKS
jgi:hypothetical protein